MGKSMSGRPSLSVSAKRRLVYAGMMLAGVLFVSTLWLPVSTVVSQLVAALAFGVMSGLWLGHLVHSL